MRDAKGVLVVYEAALDDLRRIEARMLTTGSHFLAARAAADRSRPDHPAIIEQVLPPPPRTRAHCRASVRACLCVCVVCMRVCK